jgi:spore maturation protein CgeB
MTIKKCIAYHMPAPKTIYAQKSIFEGFRNAFESKGYKFVAFTPDDNLEDFLKEHNPDIFMTASHFFYRKFLDYEILRKYRAKGMILFTKIDFWDSPLNKNRINEAPSMRNDSTAKKLIESGDLGDFYYSTSSQGDQRMEGFSKFAKQDFITIPLAADSVTLRPEVTDKFKADISFIGTNLAQKRTFFKEWLFPLKDIYDVRLYGQDWTVMDRNIGRAAKLGQYFNMPGLRSLQKPKLELGDEAKIYASSRILVNLHEDYQRKFGGDCNERTFKIPFCGGFEVVDDVEVIRDYFVDGKEIVIAKNKDEWFEKIEYYYNHPSEAKKIALAGARRAAKDHTYHNRADQIIKLFF